MVLKTWYKQFVNNSYRVYYSQRYLLVQLWALELSLEYASSFSATVAYETRECYFNNSYDLEIDSAVLE